MKFSSSIVVTLALVALVACQPQGATEQAEQTTPTPEPTPMQPSVAVAPIGPASGSDLAGEATFRKMDGEIQLQVRLENATPGPHAVHLHEFGDCSANDASSAGGHWNPTGEDHGKWGEAPFHLGDIGNVEVGEDGTGTLSLTTDLWSLGDGSDRDVVGRSVVVHSGADDFTTQPAGDSGERVGCGVVEAQPALEPGM